MGSQLFEANAWTYKLNLCGPAFPSWSRGQHTTNGQLVLHTTPFLSIEESSHSSDEFLGARKCRISKEGYGRYFGANPFSNS